MGNGIGCELGVVRRSAWGQALGASLFGALGPRQRRPGDPRVVSTRPELSHDTIDRITFEVSRLAFRMGSLVVWHAPAKTGGENRSRLREAGLVIAVAVGLLAVGLAPLVAGGNAGHSPSAISGQVQAVASASDPTVVVSISPLSTSDLGAKPAQVGSVSKPIPRWATSRRFWTPPPSPPPWTRTISAPRAASQAPASAAPPPATPPIASSSSSPYDDDAPAEAPRTYGESESAPKTYGVPAEPPQTYGVPALAAAPQAQPAAPAARNCQPPYVVDPESGKRHWKVECL